MLAKLPDETGCFPPCQPACEFCSPIHGAPPGAFPHTIYRLRERRLHVLRGAMSGSSIARRCRAHGRIASMFTIRIPGFPVGF